MNPQVDFVLSERMVKEVVFIAIRKHGRNRCNFNLGAGVGGMAHVEW